MTRRVLVNFMKTLKNTVKVKTGLGMIFVVLFDVSVCVISLLEIGITKFLQGF